MSKKQGQDHANSQGPGPDEQNQETQGETQTQEEATSRSPLEKPQAKDQQLQVVGMPVHFYRRQDGPPLAAIITDIDDRGPGLTVFHPGGATQHFRRAPFSAEPKQGHWSWPKRV